MGQVRYVESKCGTQFRGETGGEETTEGAGGTEGVDDSKAFTE